MKQTQHKPTGRAFTLIELLVVIAIIAMLIMLVFPAISNATQTSRKTACTWNMKQIGIAMQMFRGNNPNNPRELFPDDGTGTNSWSAQIASYLRASDKGTIFSCPSASIRTTNSTYSAHPTLFSTPRKSFHQIKRPQLVIMAADATQGASPAGAASPLLSRLPSANFETAGLTTAIPDQVPNDVDGSGREGALRFRHRVSGVRSACVVFADNHAESLERGKVQYQHFSLTR